MRGGCAETDRRLKSVFGRNATFVTFLLVGGATATAYYAILAVCLEILRLDYRLAVTCAYLASILFQFLMNRFVTFSANSAPALPQAVKFAVTAAINYMITLAVVSVGVQFLGISPYWSVLLALTLTTPLGFVLSRRWVFSRGSR